MKPYKYTDEWLGDLSVTDLTSPNGARYAELDADDGNHNHSRIRVAADAVPALAVALYEAAGLPEPLILENLSGPMPGDGGRDLVTVSPSPAGSAGNLPGVMLGTGGVQVRLIRSEPLRVAAALVTAMREAETEPDRATVEELAGLIEREDYDLDYESRWGLARAILLAGWKREPASAR